MGGQGGNMICETGCGKVPLKYVRHDLTRMILKDGINLFGAYAFLFWVYLDDANLYRTCWAKGYLKYRFKADCAA